VPAERLLQDRNPITSLEGTCFPEKLSFLSMVSALRCGCVNVITPLSMFQELTLCAEPMPLDQHSVGIKLKSAA
jgi:hypothetical protein